MPWVEIGALWLGVGLIDACQTVFPMRAQGMHHAWAALFVIHPHYEQETSPIFPP